MPIQDPTTHDSQWTNGPREVVRKLQFLLDTNHVTVMSLAERTGITKKLIQDILDGASLPTEAMLRKFAEFFGVTLEFILGRDDGASTQRGSAAVRSPSTGRSSSGKGSAGIAKGSSGVRKGSAGVAKGSAGPGRGTAPAGKRTKGAGSLNIRAVATRHQALVELLVEKGVISARDYSELVQRIEKRR
jgi:hypothetical protein